MKKLISMAVAIMMLVSTTVTANAATKTRVLVEGNEGRFWQTYLYGEYLTKGESCGHTGIDFISKNSSGVVAPMDVYAAEDGVVAVAGWGDEAGNNIIIDHDGYYTCYQHLSAIYVQSGDAVTAGQKIGKTGKTGSAEGIHLHFGVKVNGTNTINARNPEKYLAYLNNTGRLAGKFNYSIVYPSAASNATQVRNFTKPSSVSYTGNKFVYYIAYRDFSGTLRNCVYQVETGLITPVNGSYGMCDVVWNSPTEFALVRDGQVMSANVEGKILDEHSIDVMSGNYLAAASIDELKRERAQCKVE